MLSTEPLPLQHSWPLFEAGVRLPLGAVHDLTVPLAAPTFRCDLGRDCLYWSDGIFALYGLPVGRTPERALVQSLFDDETRQKLQRLAAYAIKHRRGVTVDVELHPLDVARRWLRITAVPDPAARGRPILYGTQSDVTHEYR